MDAVERNNKKYIYFRDLSAATGYDAEYLRKLAKAGKVDAFQLGTAWMINRDSLDAYQSGQKNRHPRATELNPSQ